MNVANIATLGVMIDPTGAESGARRANSAAKATESALENLSKAAAAAAKAMGSSSDQSAGAFTRMISAAKRMAGMVTGFFGSVVSGAFGMVKGITNAFAQIGLAIDGMQKMFAPVKGLINFLVSAVAQAAKLEQTATAIRGLLGGNGAATNVLMGQVQKLGLETPFEFDELAEATRILLAMGGNAKTVTDELRRMGDIAAVVQAPIKDIASVYGKMRQDGRIMAVDLTQLANYGIPVLQEFSKILNVPISQVRDKASEGLITFKHLEKAFENMTSKGGFAYKAMILQSETWNGKLSNLNDAWNKMLVSLGEPIIDGLNPGLDLLIGEVGKLDEVAKNIGPTLKNAALGVSAAFKVITEPGGLDLSFKASVDYLKNALRRTWEAVGILMSQIFNRVLWHFTNGMEKLASWEFWSGVGEALADGVTKAIKVMGDYARSLTAGKTTEQLTYERTRKEYTDANPSILQIEAANKAIENMANEGQRIIQSVMQGVRRQVDTGETPEWKGILKVIEAMVLVRRDTITAKEKLEAQFSKEDMRIFNEMNRALQNIQRHSSQRQLPAPEEEGPPPPVDSFGDIFSGQTSDNASPDRLEWLDKFTTAFGLMKDSATEGPESILLPPPGAVGAPGTSPETAIDLTEPAAQSKELADNMERYRDSTKTPDESLAEALKGLDEARKMNMISEEEYQKFRQQEEQKYQDMLEQTTQQETARVEKQLSDHERLTRSWMNIQKQVDQVAVGAAQSITGNLTTALTDLAAGTKSASEAFSDMANAITKDILKMITQMLVQIAYAKILGWITGTPTASFGAMFQTGMSGGNILAGYRHAGGPAEFGPSRSVPAFAFAGAPRMHNGGVVGSDEVPTILQKGETVLTRDQARDIRQKIDGKEGQSASGAVTIINVVDPAMVSEYHAQNPDAILNIMTPRMPAIRRLVGGR